MRAHRGFLYAGVFLVALGGVLVAADLGLVDVATLEDGLRLWPIAVIAIGSSLILRRTQYSLPGGMLAAAVPGLLLGGAFAVAPRFASDCGAPGQPANISTEHGAFDGPASVSVRTSCASLTVGTTAGNDWQLEAGDSAGRTASVNSSGRSLAIVSGGEDSWHYGNGGGETWNLTLPTTNVDDLSLVVNAGRGQVTLPGARIGRLAVTANAAEIVVDASAASVTTLSGAVNVGLLSIHLPAEGNLVGSVHVGGGALQVCSPPGVGLRLTSRGFAREITVDGLHQAGSEWQSPDYASTTQHADLTVNVSFGSVQINPIGGCK